MEPQKRGAANGSSPFLEFLRQGPLSLPPFHQGAGSLPCSPISPSCFIRRQRVERLMPSCSAAASRLPAERSTARS